jgi:hypothetical protein
MYWDDVGTASVTVTKTRLVIAKKEEELDIGSS